MIAERDSIESRRREVIQWNAQIAVRALLLKVRGHSLSKSLLGAQAEAVASWARDELNKACPACGALPLFDEPHDTSRH